MRERDAKAAEAALQFLGQTLDWLEGHHSRWAEVTTHDLDADERVNAIWKLSGESLAHARAYVGMLQGGYTPRPGRRCGRSTRPTGCSARSSIRTRSGSGSDHFSLAGPGPAKLSNGFTARFTTDFDSFNFDPVIHAHGDPLGFPEGTAHCDPL